MKFSRIKAPSKSRGSKRQNHYLAGADMTRHQSAVPEGNASLIYNFRYGEGVLRRGMGGQTLDLTKDLHVRSLFVYVLDGEEILLAEDSAGQIYREFGGAMQAIEGLIFQGEMRGVNYNFNGRDTAILTSDADKMAVYDGEKFYFVENSPLITSTAVHYERMFATASDNKKRIWFSDDFDPTNWKTNPNNGGFIELLDERGECGKVISHMNYIYIFRKYGITRLTAFGDETSFNVSHLFSSGGELYPNTAESVGDKIYFLASDGLYAFDGLTANKIYENISGALQPFAGAKAVFYDNVYYLFTLLRDGQKAVVEASPKAITLHRGVGADGGFTKYRQKLLLLDGGKVYSADDSGSLEGRSLVKEWTSAVTDFGYKSRFKMAEKFCIDASCGLVLTVTADGVTKSFQVPKRQGYTEIRLNLRAKKLIFSLSAEQMEQEDYIGGFEIVYSLSS